MRQTCGLRQRYGLRSHVVRRIGASGSTASQTSGSSCGAPLIIGSATYDRVHHLGVLD